MNSLPKVKTPYRISGSVEDSHMLGTMYGCSIYQIRGIRWLGRCPLLGWTSLAYVSRRLHHSIPFLAGWCGKSWQLSSFPLHHPFCWWPRSYENAQISRSQTPPSYEFLPFFSHCPLCFVGMEISGVGGWVGGCNNIVFACVLVRTCFSCRCKHAGWYAGRSSLAHADMRDDTLGDLLLQMQTGGMIRWEIFSCRCRHAGCFVCTFYQFQAWHAKCAESTSSDSKESSKHAAKWSIDILGYHQRPWVAIMGMKKKTTWHWTLGRAFSPNRSVGSVSSCHV